MMYSGIGGFLESFLRKKKSNKNIQANTNYDSALNLYNKNSSKNYHITRYNKHNEGFVTQKYLKYNQLGGENQTIKKYNDSFINSSANISKIDKRSFCDQLKTHRICALYKAGSGCGIVLKKKCKKKLLGDKNCNCSHCATLTVLKESLKNTTKDVNHTKSRTSCESLESVDKLINRRHNKNFERVTKDPEYIRLETKLQEVIAKVKTLEQHTIEEKLLSVNPPVLCDMHTQCNSDISNTQITIDSSIAREKKIELLNNKNHNLFSPGLHKITRRKNHDAAGAVIQNEKNIINNKKDNKKFKNHLISSKEQAKKRITSNIVRSKKLRERQKNDGHILDSSFTTQHKTFTTNTKDQDLINNGKIKIKERINKEDDVLQINENLYNATKENKKSETKISENNVNLDNFTSLFSEKPNIPKKYNEITNAYIKISDIIPPNKLQHIIDQDQDQSKINVDIKQIFTERISNRIHQNLKSKGKSKFVCKEPESKIPIRTVTEYSNLQNSLPKKEESIHNFCNTVLRPTKEKTYGGFSLGVQPLIEKEIELDTETTQFVMLLEKLNGKKTYEEFKDIIISIKKLEECNHTLEWLVKNMEV